MNYVLKQAEDSPKFEREFEISTNKIKAKLAMLYHLRKKQIGPVLAKSQLLLVGKAYRSYRSGNKRSFNKILLKISKTKLGEGFTLIDKKFYKNKGPFLSFFLISHLGLEYNETKILLFMRAATLD